MLEAILALTLVPPSGFVRHAGSWRKWCLARLPVRSVMFLYTNNRPFDVFSKSYYAASWLCHGFVFICAQSDERLPKKQLWFTHRVSLVKWLCVSCVCVCVSDWWAWWWDWGNGRTGVCWRRRSGRTPSWSAFGALSWGWPPAATAPRKTPMATMLKGTSGLSACLKHYSALWFTVRYTGSDVVLFCRNPTRTDILRVVGKEHSTSGCWFDSGSFEGQEVRYGHRSKVAPNMQGTAKQSPR